MYHILRPTTEMQPGFIFLMVLCI